MPRLRVGVPKYRKHRASGQAVVTLNGRDHYLGPHGTQASKIAYDRLVTEWLSRGRTSPLNDQDDAGLTIVELAAAYRTFSREYYRKRGKVTREAELIDDMITTVRSLYDDLPAQDFGPKCLKAVRQKWIDAGHVRGTINKQVGRIRRMFRWGVAEEMVPPMVLEALKAVPDLKRGRTEAKESDPVQPVSEDHIQAALGRVTRVVADMILIQRATAMRPEEVCGMKPGLIQRDGEVWRYVPEHHKMEHKGRQRVIFLGPKAQSVLARYLLRSPDDYCFSPKESEAERRTEQHERRQTPLSCGNRPGSNVKPKRSRPHRDHYSVDAYRRAIHRACEAVGIPKWSPNRLRHSAATEIRARYGIEGSQVILGHAKADVSQVYAERDESKAAAIAREIG
jgi:integrase